MQPVSQRFLDALGSPHRVETLLTATVPGGQPVTMQVKGGTVSADQSANVRRKTSIEVFGSPSDYDILTTDGCLIKILHGIKFGGESELVPVFTGEIIEGSQELGDGSISFSGADLWTWITRCKFVAPFSPNPVLTRRQVIANLVTTARPGTLVVDTATDTGLIGTVVFSENPADAITDTATAGLMEVFFAPDGSFVIRDQQTLTSNPVWTVKAGRGGTLKSAARKRPKNRLYNTVIVSPSASDGSQTWLPQTAQITDLNSPRHPSKIGVVPFKYSNPSILTGDAAMAVARRRLDLLQGQAETLDLGTVSNPALEAGDVTRIVTPTINEQPAQIFQHFTDTLSLNLGTGDMRLGTRSQNA